MTATRFAARAVLLTLAAAVLFVGWPIWLGLAAVIGFMFALDWLWAKAGWSKS